MGRPRRARGQGVLLDASNLHVGGGIQVAASLIDELARIPKHEHAWLDSLVIEASPLVCQAASSTALELLGVREIYRRPRHWRNWMPRRRKFGVSFVIFGPEFGARRADHRIVGYADVTSIYPPAGAGDRPWHRRARWAIRGWISRTLIRTADEVVVETEAMADRLYERVRIPRSQIRVVSNTYNALFDDPTRWSDPISLPEGPPGSVTFAYVARGYPHKNIDFLGRLAVELDDLGILARFVVTLRDDEWAQRTDFLQGACGQSRTGPSRRRPTNL